MIKPVASFIPLIVLTMCMPCNAQDATQLKLKDFRPKSIYRVPVTPIKKAKYPAIDMHSHVYARSEEQLTRWIKTMDESGIEKSIILSCATGPRFDSFFSKNARYPDRFELWGGFYFRGDQEPGCMENAGREIEISVNVVTRGI